MSTEPPPVQLHLHRGLGALYGIVGMIVLSLVVAGVVSNLGSGRYISALVAAVFGLGITAFLFVLSLALILPVLNVTESGIDGRMTWRRTFVLDWPQVTIDVDPEAPTGQFRLDLGGDLVTITSRAWTGFSDFVLLVASSSAAAARLTPGARTEVARLLQIEVAVPPDADAAP